MFEQLAQELLTWR